MAAARALPPLAIEAAQLVGRTPSGSKAMTIWDLQVPDRCLPGAWPSLRKHLNSRTHH